MGYIQKKERNQSTNDMVIRMDAYKERKLRGRVLQEDWINRIPISICVYFVEYLRVFYVFFFFCVQKKKNEKTLPV